MSLFFCFDFLSIITSTEKKEIEKKANGYDKDVGFLPAVHRRMCGSTGQDRGGDVWAQASGGIRRTVYLPLSRKKVYQAIGEV